MCVVLGSSSTAWADPDPAGPSPGAPAAAQAVDPAAASDPGVEPVAATGEVPPPPPAINGVVESAPPVVLKSRDGWTLKISSSEETQVSSAPLTTAISTREYTVGGIFDGSLTGGDGESPAGVFEVGYQIGCGIDMSTSNGVQLGAQAGYAPAFGEVGGLFPSLFVEPLRGTIGGTISVGLKPGIVNTVAVTKKKFKGATPFVQISNFRIKIDGCVGQSFIRSYATLAKSNDLGDVILSWYGTTTSV